MITPNEVRGTTFATSLLILLLLLLPSFVTVAVTFTVNRAETGNKAKHVPSTFGLAYVTVGTAVVNKRPGHEVANKVTRHVFSITAQTVVAPTLIEPATVSLGMVAAIAIPATIPATIATGVPVFALMLNAALCRAPLSPCLVRTFSCSALFLDPRVLLPSVPVSVTVLGGRGGMGRGGLAQAAVAAAVAAVRLPVIMLITIITTPTHLIGTFNTVASIASSNIAIEDGDVAVSCWRSVGLPLPSSRFLLAGPSSDSVRTRRLSSLLSRVGDVLDVLRHLLRSPVYAAAVGRDGHGGGAGRGEAGRGDRGGRRDRGGGCPRPH